MIIDILMSQSFSAFRAATGAGYGSGAGCCLVTVPQCATAFAAAAGADFGRGAGSSLVGVSQSTADGFTAINAGLRGNAVCCPIVMTKAITVQRRAASAVAIGKLMAQSTAAFVCTLGAGFGRGAGSRRILVTGGVAIGECAVFEVIGRAIHRHLTAGGGLSDAVFHIIDLAAVCTEAGQVGHGTVADIVPAAVVLHKGGGFRCQLTLEDIVPAPIILD